MNLQKKITANDEEEAEGEAAKKRQHLRNCKNIKWQTDIN